VSLLALAYRDGEEFPDQRYRVRDLVDETRECCGAGRSVHSEILLLAPERPMQLPLHHACDLVDETRECCGAARLVLPSVQQYALVFSTQEQLWGAS
jgi:hypothetical protein